MLLWIVGLVTWVAVATVIAVVIGRFVRSRRQHRARGRANVNSHPVRVMVGSPDPMEQELARFFLEEGGCQIVGKPSKAGETILQAGFEEPDVVVLFGSALVEE